VGSVRCVAALLQAGADPSAPDEAGVTPVETAAEPPLAAAAGAGRGAGAAARPELDRTASLGRLRDAAAAAAAAARLQAGEAAAAAAARQLLGEVEREEREERLRRRRKQEKRRRRKEALKERENGRRAPRPADEDAGGEAARAAMVSAAVTCGHAPAAVHGVEIHGASMKRLAAPEQPPRAAEARARPTECSLTEQSLRCDDERQEADHGESQDEMEGEPGAPFPASIFLDSNIGDMGASQSQPATQME
jgi:hypothetical protein